MYLYKLYTLTQYFLLFMCGLDLSSKHYSRGVERHNEHMHILLVNFHYLTFFIKMFLWVGITLCFIIPLRTMENDIPNYTRLFYLYISQLNLKILKLFHYEFFFKKKDKLCEFWSKKQCSLKLWTFEIITNISVNWSG